MPYAYVVLFLSVAFWLWMCVDCLLRRDGLTPMFGSKQRALGFWVLLLLACNPILTVLYACFGRRAWTRAWKPWKREGLVVVTALFGIALQFGPFGGRDSATEIKGKPLPFRSGLSAQVTQMGQGFNTVTSRGDGRSLAPRTIRVTYSDDDFSWLCARELAADFAAEWWTDSVELWPREHAGVDGALAPDLFVDIHGPRELPWPTPLLQVFDGELSFYASSAPHPMGASFNTDGLPAMGRIELRGDIQFSFYSVGFALGAERHGKTAGMVAEQLNRILVKPYREAADAAGQALRLPGANFPMAPPELPKALLAKNPEFLGWDHGPFVHSRARYRFYDERPFGEVLEELSQDLEAEGLGRAISKESAVDGRGIKIQKEAMVLVVGKWPSPKPEGYAYVGFGGKVMGREGKEDPSAPFLIKFETRFNQAEYERLALEYAEEPMNVEGLLLLWNITDSVDVRERLRARLQASPEPRSDRWLVLARLQKEAGDLPEARASAKRAEGLAHANSDKQSEKVAQQLVTQLDTALAERTIEDRFSRPSDGGGE